MTDKPGIEQFLSRTKVNRRDFLRIAAPGAAASIGAFLAACKKGTEVTPPPPTQIPSRPTEQPTPIIPEPVVRRNPVDVINEINKNNPSIVDVGITQQDGSVTSVHVVNLHPTYRTMTLNPELIVKLNGLVYQVLPPDTDTRYASGERMVIMWDARGGDMFKGKNPIVPELGTYPLTITYDNEGKGFHVTFIPVDYTMPASPNHIEALATEWCQGSTGVALPNEGQQIQDEVRCNGFGYAARLASQGGSYETYTSFVHEHPLAVPGLSAKTIPPLSVEHYQEMVDALQGTIPLIQYP